MLYLFLIYYTYILLSNRKSYVVVFLTLLQLISVVAAILIKMELEIDSVSDVLCCMLMLFVNTSVITCWRKSSKVKKITGNSHRIEKIRKFFFVIMPFIWSILFIVAVTVISLVGDSINEFKYGDGNSTDFFYTMLPINVKWYILASILYQLSYFMFPFHFYYLSRHEYKYAIICLFYSTSILLFGATFFSRWTILQYFLLYITLFLVCKDTIAPTLIKKMRKVLFVTLILFGVGFITISITRFEDNTHYEKTIPSYSVIQDPTLYSFCDYLGQANRNGLEVLKNYNGSTLLGGYTFDAVRSTLSAFRIFPYDSEKYRAKREVLFGAYSGGFTGLTAYSVMDYGIILTLILFLLYAWYIPKHLRKIITFHDLCLIMCFVQIPICSMFYSWASTVCFLLFCYSFIYLYLYIKR